MTPIKLTTLVVQMSQPRHLAVLIRMCGNLRDLIFLAPKADTRTAADLLEDWEHFQDALNEAGGMNQIQSLSLQDWDHVPNVEMKKYVCKCRICKFIN